MAWIGGGGFEVGGGSTTTVTGAVDSVNGLTGIVLLNADSIPPTSSRLWLTGAERTTIAGVAAADANLAAGIAANAAEISALVAADATHNSQISTLQTGQTTLFADLAALSLGQSASTTAIADLQAADAAFSLDLAALEARVTTNETAIGNTSTALAGKADAAHTHPLSQITGAGSLAAVNPGAGFQISGGALSHNIASLPLRSTSASGDRFIVWDNAAATPYALSRGDLLSAASLGYQAEDTANKNQPLGYAGLNNDGKIPISLLPSSVQVFRETFYVANLAARDALAVGWGAQEAGYAVSVANKGDGNAGFYSWNGASFDSYGVTLTNTDSVPEGATNLYYTDLRVAAAPAVAANTAAVTALDARLDTAEAILAAGYRLSSIGDDSGEGKANAALAVAGLRADINVNAANIAANTASISTNAANIAANTASISTNAANIAANATAIALNTAFRLAAATQPEAEAGTEVACWMSPLRTAQFLAKQIDDTSTTTHLLTAAEIDSRIASSGTLTLPASYPESATGIVFSKTGNTTLASTSGEATFSDGIGNRYLVILPALTHDLAVEWSPTANTGSRYPDAGSFNDGFYRANLARRSSDGATKIIFALINQTLTVSGWAFRPLPFVTGVVGGLIVPFAQRGDYTIETPSAIPIAYPIGIGPADYVISGCPPVPVVANLWVSSGLPVFHPTASYALRFYSPDLTMPVLNNKISWESGFNGTISASYITSDPNGEATGVTIYSSTGKVRAEKSPGGAAYGDSTRYPTIRLVSYKVL